jgi:hypothetical protein
MLGCSINNKEKPMDYRIIGYKRRLERGIDESIYTLPIPLFSRTADIKTSKQ